MFLIIFLCLYYLSFGFCIRIRIPNATIECGSVYTTLRYQESAKKGRKHVNDRYNADLVKENIKSLILIIILYTGSTSVNRVDLLCWQVSPLSVYNCADSAESAISSRKFRSGSFYWYSANRWFILRLICNEALRQTIIPYPVILFYVITYSSLFSPFLSIWQV
jgi:hypothetical protein